MSDKTDPSLEEIKGFLLAVGLTSATRSYDSRIKQYKDMFVKLPLKEVAPVWDNVDDQIRIDIVKAHNAEFKEWINSAK